MPLNIVIYSFILIEFKIPSSDPIAITAGTNNSSSFMLPRLPYVDDLMRKMAAKGLVYAAVNKETKEWMAVSTAYEARSESDT